MQLSLLRMIRHRSNPVRSCIIQSVMTTSGRWRSDAPAFQAGSRLVMQPHPLSHCLPETGQTPEEAEVLGRVRGEVIRPDEAENILAGESPAARGGWSRKAP